MTQQDLEHRLDLWQHRLRLVDWDITIYTRRHWELEGVCGTITMVPSKRAAVIGILDPNDFQPDEFTIDSVDRLIVHELLHIHLLPLEPRDEDSPLFTALEQAVDAIAGALTGGLRGHTIPERCFKGWKETGKDAG